MAPAIALPLVALAHLSFEHGSGGPDLPPFQVQLVDIAPEAGLHAVGVFGSEENKRWIIETTGGGIAFVDYDNDGWLDIFQVNGTTLEGFPAAQEPTSHLYRNNRDGTFSDVTQAAGLARSGWGQGVCAGDFDNDGKVDLFVTYWGQNSLYKNQGDGTFVDVTPLGRFIAT